MGCAAKVSRRPLPDGTRPVNNVVRRVQGWPHDHRRAFEAGFDAHLVKPPDPEELREQARAPA